MLQREAQGQSRTRSREVGQSQAKVGQSQAKSGKVQRSPLKKRNAVYIISMTAKLIGGADMRVKITLACTECKQRNYNTKKNKKNDPDRLEMNKYCKFCRKHTLHKETK